MRFLVRLRSPPRVDRRGAAARPCCWTGSASDPNLAVAALRALVVTVVDVVVFVVLARLLRIREVTDVLDTVTRRLPVRTTRMKRPTMTGRA